MKIFSNNQKCIMRFILPNVLFLMLLFTALPVFANGSHTENKKLILIDAHNHLIGQFHTRFGEVVDYDGAVQAAVSNMNRLGIKMMIVMPPPFIPERFGAFNLEYLAHAVKKYPGRFAFLGGGESLNIMIQKSVHKGIVTLILKERFKKKALEILNCGALGFGELACEHFSLGPRHPYEWAPPDHPLFLLLADIAAKHNVPIYIHMEAVPKDMPLPSYLKSPPNPKILHANIAAFERLLNHNPQAKIVWVQAGWDHTGYRTPQLCAELLKRHKNLYMTIKISPLDSPSKNSPLNANGKIKLEWINLFREFPNRFVLGTDQFYLSPKMHRRIGPQRSDVSHNFFLELPPELARKIGYENPIRIFNLRSNTNR